MSTTTDFTPAEIAAAGGHNLLITTGPCGKAARTGRTLDTGKVVYIRPTTTAAAIFGKHDHEAKGTLEKAHQGTVILDDATRFDPAILDNIRTTHDTKRVRLYKGSNITPTVNEPADFRMIIGTRNRDPRTLTGPLLDRIDITTHTATAPASNPTALADARAAQTERLELFGASTNATAPHSIFLGELALGRNTLTQLDNDLDRAQITLRGYVRTLRVAWTLADLTGKTTPTAHEIGVARTLHTL